MYVPCPSSFGELCLSYNGESRLEFPGLFFSQLGGNGLLLFYVILGVFTIALFNICGVNVTKHISSLARSIVDVTRTILVWIGSIIITQTYGSDNPNFSWELTDTGAILMELFGFIILVVGNLVYNKIIILPFAKPPTSEAMQLLDAQEKDQLVSMQEQQGNHSRRSSFAGNN